MQFVIHSKSGKSIKDFSHSPHEEEVLLRPKTQFEILEREEKDGKTYIYMRKKMTTEKELDKMKEDLESVKEQEITLAPEKTQYLLVCSLEKQYKRKAQKLEKF